MSESAPHPEPLSTTTASESTSKDSDPSSPGCSPNVRAVENGNRPSCWLHQTDQIFVCVLLVALTSLLTVHWLKLSRWGAASVEISSQQSREYFYSLDINSASWVEWAQLEGIGEKLAKRIVADRDERGPFRDSDDVGRVRGISAKLLEKMKPFLRGGSAGTQPGAP